MSALTPLQMAINRLSQGDPLIKLLEQVKLGRMKPTDPGLRAVMETWLRTYSKTLEEAAGWDALSLRRIDPRPRLAVLKDHGVLPDDHAFAKLLFETYERLSQVAAEPLPTQ